MCLSNQSTCSLFFTVSKQVGTQHNDGARGCGRDDILSYIYMLQWNVTKDLGDLVERILQLPPDSITYPDILTEHLELDWSYELKIVNYASIIGLLRGQCMGYLNSGHTSHYSHKCSR